MIDINIGNDKSADVSVNNASKTNVNVDQIPSSKQSKIHVTLSDNEVTTVSVDNTSATIVKVSDVSTSGTPGGYYIPSVISGYIHWTPSRSGMSSVDDSYIGIKHDTTANWNAQPLYVPYNGDIIIYEDYKVIDDIMYAGIKIGDGNAYLIDLPFIDAAVLDAINNHIANTSYHVTDDDRIRWDNKVSCYEDNGNLIFNNT